MYSRVIDEIETEISHQQELKAKGKFSYTCEEMGDTLNFIVCAEEFGEIAEAIQCEKTPAELREEIVQLTACLVCWLQCTEVKQDVSPLSARASVLLYAGRDLERLARQALREFDPLELRSPSTTVSASEVRSHMPDALPFSQPEE